MWVKTGSADEKKGEEGISHFIEHLVFKGTESSKSVKSPRSVEAAGGELNAYTSFDQTVFYVTISKEFENVGLDVISEMMGFPKFDEGEINNEREVVIEENERSNDSPHRRRAGNYLRPCTRNIPMEFRSLATKIISILFRAKTLVNYFNSRYNPKTMTLIVAVTSVPEMKKKI